MREGEGAWRRREGVCSTLSVSLEVIKHLPRGMEKPAVVHDLFFTNGGLRRPGDLHLFLSLSLSGCLSLSLSLFLSLSLSGCVRVGKTTDKIQKVKQKTPGTGGTGQKRQCFNCLPRSLLLHTAVDWLHRLY